MKTKVIHIFFLISTICLLIHPSMFAQQTGGNNHQFDFLRIGNPALYQSKTNAEKPELESLEVESWMLSTDDWNLQKPVVCAETQEKSKVRSFKNKLHELGITQEILLVFAITFAAMFFS